MAEEGEYLTIAEVSALLGVHRNTVRNRVKAGRYKARKVVTPQGETYAIARDSLGDPSQGTTNDHAQPLTTPVRHNWSATAPQRGDLAGQEHAQADAVVQRLLAPFIAEQTRLAEELGATRAERDAALRRAEAAELELSLRKDSLSGQPDNSSSPSPPAPPSEAEAPGATGDTADPPGGAGGLRGWLRRVFGGE